MTLLENMILNKSLIMFKCYNAKHLTSINYISNINYAAAVVPALAVALAVDHAALLRIGAKLSRTDHKLAHDTAYSIAHAEPHREQVCEQFEKVPLEMTILKAD